jgi:catechol 2,3-dioxygenase-like lactoylglutathione lyase family enzyme
MADQFVQITPVMFVPDLDAGVAFFRDLLGFTLHVQGGGYAYLHRETVGVRLMDPTITGPVAPGTRRFGLYIDVRDVDAVYAELAPKLAALPAGDVHGPADKPYGQRELCILAPDGDLVVFGSPLNES